MGGVGLEARIRYCRDGWGIFSKKFSTILEGVLYIQSFAVLTAEEHAAK